jgi:hypothetical protein
MANPTSRETLKEYCLRELGDPVLEINVDDAQLEDRIDQVIDYWRLYHYEGIEQVYLKCQIKASRITLTTNNAASYSLENTITGVTSGATATVTRENAAVSSDNTLIVKNVVGIFIAGETITNGTVTATLASGTPCVLGEYDKRYIDIDDSVLGIQKVLSIGQASSSKNMFDLQYQLRLNDLYDLTSTSIIYYKQVMQHLDLLDITLNGQTLYRFNRLQNRLFLDINWAQNISFGDYIIVQAYRALDPVAFSKVWNENWIKRYCTAQFKRQWGTNMKKFGGLQLPGGVVLNGKDTYDEAMAEIQALEDELQNKSAPLEFFLG